MKATGEFIRNVLQQTIELLRNVLQQTIELLTTVLGCPIELRWDESMKQSSNVRKTRVTD
jgi:hypothetical protein